MAGGAYAGQLVDWAYALGGWLIEVVKRAKNSHSFEVLPRRWVVERTLGWLGRNRRLSKDYEELTESSEAWVYIAMTHLMLHAQKAQTRLSLLVTHPLGWTLYIRSHWTIGRRNYSCGIFVIWFLRGDIRKVFTETA